MLEMLSAWVRGRKNTWDHGLPQHFRSPGAVTNCLTGVQIALAKNGFILNFTSPHSEKFKISGVSALFADVYWYEPFSFL